MKIMGAAISDSHAPLLAEHAIVQDRKSMLYEKLAVASGEPGDDYDFVVVPEVPTLFPEKLSPKIQQFLQETGLTTGQLQAAGIPFDTLNALLNKGYWGHVLRWLALESLFAKVTLFPVLDERGIQHTAITSKNLECIAMLSEWVSARAWPKARALPFKSETMLKRAYGIDAFYDGVETIITRVWSILLASFLIDDLHYYFKPGPYIRPVLKSIFLGQSANEQALVTFLSRPDHIYAAVIFLSVPLSWGIVKALQASYWRTPPFDEDALRVLQQFFKNYQPQLLQDTLAWLLPFNSMRSRLDATRRALLWDNRLSAEQRIRLFTDFQQFARRTQKITQQHSLEILRDIADGLSMRDFVRLHRLGVEPAILGSLLRNKTQALVELQHLVYYAQRPFQYRDKNCYNRWINPFVCRLTAHYFLWCLGQSSSKGLQPLFWMFKAVRLYVKINFVLLVYSGLHQAIQFYRNKNACLAAGRRWDYINVINAYNCTVCADLPVSYLHSFTVQNCLTDYLHIPRTAEQIVGLINRIQRSDNVTLLDFSNQRFVNEEDQSDLTRILPVVQQQIPELLCLNLNTSTQGWIGLAGAQAIAFYLTSSRLNTLYLVNQAMGDNGTQLLSQALPYSMLQTLGLDGNNIGVNGAQSLAQFLPASRLQTLSVSENNVGDGGVQALALALPYSRLNFLNLLKNEISDEGIKALVLGFSHSILQALDLSNNPISAIGIQRLALALPNSTLLSLNLDGILMGGNGIQALAQALPYCQLRILSLSEDNIGDEGAQVLALALPQTSLQILGLSKNNISDDGAQALASALPGSHLQFLRLEVNHIGDKGIQALALVLPNSTVQMLALSVNVISAKGAQALAQALLHSPLQYLYLRENDVGDNGTESLAETLPFSQLQTLELGANNLSERGMQTLALALANTTLQTLYVGNNNISEEGAESLAFILPASHLQVLNLSGNGIGNRGLQALAQALPHSTLKTLHLWSNAIGDEGVQAIASVLPASTLQVLNLEGNNIGDKGAWAMSRALTKVPPLLHPLWLDFLYPSDHPTFTYPESTTFLTQLDLSYNQINNTGARALCQQIPWTDITVQNLDLSSNPIDDISIVDSSGFCVISSAASLQPPLPLRIFYRCLLQPLQNMYLSVYDWKRRIRSTDPMPAIQILEENEKPANEYDQKMELSFSAAVVIHTDMQSSLSYPVEDAFKNPDFSFIPAVPLNVACVPQNAHKWITFPTAEDHLRTRTPCSATSEATMNFFVPAMGALLLLYMVYRFLGSAANQGIHTLMHSFLGERGVPWHAYQRATFFYQRDPLPKHAEILLNHATEEKYTAKKTF